MNQPVISSMETFLFDPDGCIYYGDVPAGGAHQLLELLQTEGKRCMFSWQPRGKSTGDSSFDRRFASAVKQAHRASGQTGPFAMQPDWNAPLIADLLELYVSSSGNNLE